MTYRLLTPALVELSEAVNFYEARAPGLGGDFLGEFEAAVERILQFPEAWGRLSDNYRHCHLRRFPFSLIYALHAETKVTIVSVFHQNREPLSWMRNL